MALYRRGLDGRVVYCYFVGVFCFLLGFFERSKHDHGSFCAHVSSLGYEVALKMTMSRLPEDYDEFDIEEGNSTDVFVVAPEEVGERLDVTVAARLHVSRSLVQDWIKRGLVELSGKTVSKPAEKLRRGQTVGVERPALRPAKPEPDPSIPIVPVYEDSHILVLNKPRGLTVHPGSGAPDGTLVNGLLAYCHDLSGIHGEERPGIVHRLDKDTSGLMVVAKNDAAHAELSRQFAAREVTKVYVALVHGVPPEIGIIDQPIARHPSERKRMAVRRGGREARTDFQVLETFASGFALVQLHLHSGRTHQIRVHMTWLGFPLVGDPVYGKRPNPWGLQGQALHCERLGFVHPATGERLEFAAEIPSAWGIILEQLRNNHAG